MYKAAICENNFFWYALKTEFHREGLGRVNKMCAHKTLCVTMELIRA
jgi:hypothetical protein